MKKKTKQTRYRGIDTEEKKVEHQKLNREAQRLLRRDNNKYSSDLCEGIRNFSHTNETRDLLSQRNGKRI